MSTISTKPFTPTPFAPPAPLPPKHGDSMSAEELILRYEAMPEEWRARNKRVELIEGVVRMPPISMSSHGEEHFDFIAYLGVYRWSTPGVIGGAPTSVILDTKMMPEPDALLIIDPKCGGRIRLDEKGYIHGAPELIAEFSSSRLNHDLIAKKELYRKFAVKEYVVWRVKERIIDWFILRGDQFELLPCADGVYRSEAFPGLWLSASALIGGDFTTANQVLQQGLASQEHLDFVEQLRRNSAQS